MIDDRGSIVVDASIVVPGGCVVSVVVVAGSVDVPKS